MKTFVRKNDWLPNLSFYDHGWGNGYVVIPPGHPCHGVDYDEIDVDVHGGLTFGQKASECADWPEIEDSDKDCWIVGFDTAHYGDTIRQWPMSRVLDEIEKLKNQLEAM